MNKKLFGVLLSSVLCLSGFSFLAGCGDKKTKNQGGDSGYNLDIKYNFVGDSSLADRMDFEKGYTIENFSVADSVVSMSQDMNVFETVSNKKVTFELGVRKGWLVEAGQSLNFKVLLSNDQTISDDDMEIEKANSTQLVNGVSLYNLKNVYLRNSLGTAPENIPYYGEEDAQYFSYTDGTFLSIADYIALDEDEKANYQKFYSRTLENYLEGDYDLDRSITYEFDGKPAGNYYILVQTDEDKSQELSPVNRTISINIPAQSGNHITVAQENMSGAIVGENFEEGTQSFTAPYGSTLNLNISYNTTDATAKYYDLENYVLQNLGSSVGGVLLSADGKKLSLSSTLCFDKQTADIEARALTDAISKKTRYFKIDMMTTNALDDISVGFYINQNNVDNYNSNGFSIEIKKNDDGWTDPDINNNGESDYFFQDRLEIDSTYSIRIKIDKTLNKLSGSNYYMSYETRDPHSPISTFSTPEIITGDVDEEDENFIFITFNNITTAQTGDMNSFNLNDLKLIIDNVNAALTREPAPEV